MRKLLLILVLMILIPNISASCEEGQIDINIASAEELDEIKHVGPKVAGYIIEKRPFDSIDDLVEVAYISEGYLEDIKEQNLACVNGQEKESDEEEEEKNGEVNEEPQETKPLSKETTPIELQTINLNPQVIKSDDNKEGVSKNYAVYGFVGFCILIGILFIIKNRKHKNEFR